MICPSCKRETYTYFIRCPVCNYFLQGPEGTEVAGFGIRLVAILLDAVVGIVVMGIAFLVVALLAGADYGTGHLLASYLLAILAYWGLLAIFWVNGQSPGKAALGLYVYKTDGERASFFLMLVRETIGKWISGLVFDLGFLWAAWDKDRQAWHDKIFSTVVVRKTAWSADRQPSPVPRPKSDRGRDERPAGWLCPGCGRSLKPAWRFCPYCQD